MFLGWDDAFLDSVDQGGPETIWFWESPAPFVVVGHGQQVERDQSLQQAAQLMADNDCGSPPVSDSGNLCGVITDRDITVRGVAAGMPPSHQLHHAMSAELVSISSDATTEKASELMAERQLRRLYVVDDGSLA